MNFLAHFVLATRFLTPSVPRPAYVLGSALPDLLPLAAPRLRLRPVTITRAPADTPEDRALADGVRVHLATDAAFHQTVAFAQAQSAVGGLIEAAGFDHVRVRRFFLAHVLTEMALDAALLRREPGLAEAFYAAFGAADFSHAARWTARAADVPVPLLPGVLARFHQARYLVRYADDAGLAEGVRRLNLRARQDDLDGVNAARLEQLAGKAVPVIDALAPALLQETARVMG